MPGHIEIDAGPGGVVVSCWRCGLFDILEVPMKIGRAMELQHAFVLKHAGCPTQGQRRGTAARVPAPAAG